MLTALRREEGRRDAEICLLHDARNATYHSTSLGSGDVPQPLESSSAAGTEPHQASILKTSYKTRCKKERHENLFPELVKEIDEERRKQSAEAKWPDQSAEAYKDEAEREATGLFGP